MMAGPHLDIDTALSSKDSIPRDHVIFWIEATPDSDLQTLSKLYRLTDEHYSRIQPELGMEPTCALIQRYLLGCIRDGVIDDEEIQERYEAAATMHAWFLHLAKMDGTHDVLEAAASALTKLYLESGEKVRGAIECGFLEHALETEALRKYFEHWSSDARLQPAWTRSIEWGEAHPNFTSGMLQDLQNKSKNED